MYCVVQKYVQLHNKLEPDTTGSNEKVDNLLNGLTPSPVSVVKKNYRDNIRHGYGSMKKKVTKTTNGTASKITVGPSPGSECGCDITEDF